MQRLQPPQSPQLDRCIVKPLESGFQQGLVVAGEVESKIFSLACQACQSMWNIQIAETSLVIPTSDLLTIEPIFDNKDVPKSTTSLKFSSNFSAHNDDHRSKSSSLMGYDGSPPWKLTNRPPKIGLPNRKIVFQPSICKGELLVGGRVSYVVMSVPRSVEDNRQLEAQRPSPDWSQQRSSSVVMQRLGDPPKTAPK